MPLYRLVVMILTAAALPLAAAAAQTPSGAPAPSPKDPAPNDGQSRIAPVEAFGGADSVTYRLLPTSRFDLQTGKAGLFGFAGHTHVIHAAAFTGQVVYYPKTPDRSRVEIVVPTESLRVLTPPDTAEIRKVTEAMRTEVLHVDRYPEMRFVSRSVKVTPNGLHMVAALTMEGQTREVPIDLVVALGPDSVRAQGKFSVKQTDFGIKPYSGGPGGSVKVADRVGFDIDAIAARVAEGAVGAK